ncbi:methyltransferase [Maribrevibacterium harenarium]|uniref:Methyltransferase n=1 Tax=Maribrevibacterium harenarium TaxID=2589817 RepID=A0A501WC56_9GAMM|nr:methyltransferase [Maribrevibacterium harenarium]TPE46978.1 methyltransferase [Maribrevibacterium harenarium]
MTILSDAFFTLDHWLSRHRQWWDVQTFQQLDWPWRQTQPEFCEWLDGAEINLSGVDWLLEHGGITPPPDTSWLREGSMATSVMKFPPRMQNGIKGRKWQQIEAFCQHIRPAGATIEWCAGKGHLGKAIAHQFQVPVVSLEWQQSLCEEGQHVAEQLQLPQGFIHADVLKGEGDSTLANGHMAVALHACGDLHRVLIETGSASKLPQFAIAPCCYHLTREETYTPLSNVGRHAKTTLHRDNLKLAVKEVATAGAREQRLRELELTYRLGFDSWQREARDIDEYLNIPSLPKQLLSQGFGAFCQWAIEQKQLPFSLNEAEIDHYLTIGQQRRQQVARIEEITQYFRRPLELWLVLDRALRLEEQGYQVQVKEFCDYALTPRNLLILAKEKTDK